MRRLSPNLRPHLHAILGVVSLLAMTWAQQGLTHGQASAPDSEDGSRAITFPDTADHMTLVVDLHTHSVFSDGHVWPSIRVGEALRDGLHAIAVTEHLEYQPHLADIPHPDRNRAYEATLEAAKDTDLMVIAGTEITRGDPAGHMNAIFISDANAILNVDNPPADSSDTRAYYEAAAAWPVQNAVDAAHAQNAFIFWNHPYWTVQRSDGIARMTDFHQRNIAAGKLHGIEIANGNDYSAEAHAIALDYDLALIGVSDVHNLIDWDYPPYPPHENHHRPVNLVLADERSQDAMLQASLSITNAAYRNNSQVLESPSATSPTRNFVCATCPA